MNIMWFRTSTHTPPEGRILLTKVDNDIGIRNIQFLVFQNGLWFVPDMSMYVYYTPTHWQEV